MPVTASRPYPIKTDLSGKYQTAFVRTQCSPIPRLQFVQAQFPDLDPNEAQRRMSDRCCHAPNLPVFTFDQLHADPAIGYRFADADRRDPWRNFRLRIENPCAAGERLSAMDHDAPGQLLHRISGWNSLDLRPVNSLMRAARMEQFLIQSGFVAEQEQSFRIGVEPSERIHPLGKVESGQRAVARPVVSELRNHSEWFVEGDEHPCPVSTNHGQRTEFLHKQWIQKNIFSWTAFVPPGLLVFSQRKETYVEQRTNGIGIQRNDCLPRHRDATTPLKPLRMVVQANAPGRRLRHGLATVAQGATGTGPPEIIAALVILVAPRDRAGRPCLAALQSALPGESALHEIFDEGRQAGAFCGTIRRFDRRQISRRQFPRGCEARKPNLSLHRA